MKKYLTKFDNIIKKIGKQNFILIIFIFVMIVATSLYKTFSIYTESNGQDIVDGLSTYKFILANHNENSVTIASNNSKNLMITISNLEDITLKYGIYYSSSDNLTDVNIGYLETSKYPSIGLINPKSDYIIPLKIVNNSSNNITITFGTKYGFENGGDLVIDDNQHWLDVIKEAFPLNTVEPSSYVQYTGTNGCTGESCNGQNANYVSDTDMGYCESFSSKFSVNGWRVGYIKDGSAYLVAAGANECLCTDCSGISSNSSCSSITSDSGELNSANLNQASLKYCNPEFAYGGACNSNSAWAMNTMNFQNITGKVLSSSSCYNSSSDATCGYGKDLVDNGGFYWYSSSGYGTTTSLTSSSTNIVSYLLPSPCASADPGANAFNWIPNYRYVSRGISNGVYGARAVLRLDSNVVVVGGSGTYEDPYQIENLT